MRNERPHHPGNARGGHRTSPKIEDACCAGADRSCSLPPAVATGSLGRFTAQILTLFGVVFGVVLFVVVLGEWLGLFELNTKRVPWPVGLGA